MVQEPLNSEAIGVDDDPTVQLAYERSLERFRVLAQSFSQDTGHDPSMRVLTFRPSPTRLTPRPLARMDESGPNSSSEFRREYYRRRTEIDDYIFSRWQHYSRQSAVEQNGWMGSVPQDPTPPGRFVGVLDSGVSVFTDRPNPPQDSLEFISRHVRRTEELHANSVVPTPLPVQESSNVSPRPNPFVVEETQRLIDPIVNGSTTVPTAREGISRDNLLALYAQLSDEMVRTQPSTVDHVNSLSASISNRFDPNTEPSDEQQLVAIQNGIRHDNASEVVSSVIDRPMR